MLSYFLDKAKKHLEENLDPKVKRRIETISRKNINAFGVDPFGFDPEILKWFAPIAVWFYRHYFRCAVTGVEHIPQGKMLVIANHSGQLPFDAMMIETAFLLEPKKPRVLRGMAERWSAELPFVSTLFSRGGHVVGDPRTCKKLLEMGEGVMVFPEGVKGINKLFNQRYQLIRFGHGFMRLALQTGAPIVPVALVGAEEQAPAIANFVSLAKLFGAPALPLILPQIVPLPLPTKYHIQIGKPLYFEGDGTEDNDIIAKYVQQTKDVIQQMLNEGVTKRKSVFF